MPATDVGKPNGGRPRKSAGIDSGEQIAGLDFCLCDVFNRDDRGAADGFNDGLRSDRPVQAGSVYMCPRPEPLTGENRC